MDLALFDLMVSKPGQADNKIEGIVIGLVTNNKDDEKLGRVKIKFPSLGDGDESYWARVATLMAGDGRGSFFLPEVGDEVVVAFDHGDINHPYVLGSLWNPKSKPPVSNDDGKNNIRKIRSRSGHEITFSDEDAKEKIEIKTKSGHIVLLDDTAGQEKIEIKDKSGNNSVQIDSSQKSITIKSDLKLSIKSKSVEIESEGSMSIKANANLIIQGAIVKIN